MGNDSSVDGGAPVSALAVAADAVRDFNHRSRGPMALDRPGWRYVPDAYDCLGELAELTGRLPQAFDQITAAVRHQQEQNLVKFDPGTSFADDPATAVATVADALERASEAAHQLYRSLDHAHDALSAASYARRG